VWGRAGNGHEWQSWPRWCAASADRVRTTCPAGSVFGRGSARRRARWGRRRHVARSGRGADRAAYRPRLGLHPWRRAHAVAMRTKRAPRHDRPPARRKHMTARDDNLRLLNSPDGRAGLRSLTAVERALFGGLISAFTLFAIPLFVLAVLLLMAMLARSTTAAVTGRRWRRSIAGACVSIPVCDASSASAVRPTEVGRTCGHNRPGGSVDRTSRQEVLPTVCRCNHESPTLQGFRS
jgi:hypothetical protein